MEDSSDLCMEVNYEIKQEPEAESCSQPDMQKITQDADGFDNLYKDHQIKEEMVIGPTEFIKTVNASSSELVKPSSEGSSKKQKLECNKENESSSINNDSSKYLKRKEKYSSRKTRNKQQKTSAKSQSDDKMQYKESFDLHTSEKCEFRCNICFKCFTFKNNLARHFKEFHDCSKNEYSCNDCKVTFAKRSSYYYHITKNSTCSKSNTHVCLCGKYFKNKSNYDRHKKVCSHIASKYICDSCNKNFQHKSSLTRHISHLHMVMSTQIKTTDNQPANTINLAQVYPCEICGKNFSYLYNLSRHLLSHTGKRPEFPCSICNKSFTRLYSLNRHLISHTGKRPFKCSKCNITFKSHGGCQTHEKACTKKRIL